MTLTVQQLIDALIKINETKGNSPVYVEGCGDPCIDAAKAVVIHEDGILIERF